MRRAELASDAAYERDDYERDEDALHPKPHPKPNPNPNPAKAMDWHKLRSMPSGRLFWLLPGDVLVLPAGTRHAAPRMVAMHRPHAT